MRAKCKAACCAPWLRAKPSISTLASNARRAPRSIQADTMDVLTSPAAWIALAFGYLLGSIPFGLILTRMAGLGDVRKIGSGNIGATNVLRTGHKGLAALTLVLDALKGTAAVLIAHDVTGVYFGLAVVAGLLAG